MSNVPIITPPATIAGGGNWNSGVIVAPNVGSWAAAATLSQAGTITLQRYIDNAGTIAIGAAVTATLTANTANYVSVEDNLPSGSYAVVIANTSGSTGNLTNVFVRTMAP